MSVSMRSVVSFTVATLLAALLSMAVFSVAMPVADADAARLTACVNKKNGDMKMRFGKNWKWHSWPRRCAE